ncbi:MAG: hypothetical protein KC731_28705 [Myxococcales bacterium]|nr:hypothetical protein [Myxococcales bacterium]
MKRWLPHIGIVVGILIAVYALFFSTSDEDAIREQLERLEAVAAVSADDTNIVVRTAHVRKELSELVTEDVTFEIPELTTEERGRVALAGLAASAPRLFRTASVDLDGLAIDIDQQATTAIARGPAVLTGTRQSGELDRDRRTVAIRFDKIDGDWRVVSLSVSARESDL